MKSLFNFKAVAVLFSLTTTLLQAQSAKADDFIGVVQMKGSSSIALHDDIGRVVSFHGGSAQLHIEPRKSDWLMDSVVSFATENGRKVKFTVPNRSFEADGKSFQVLASQTGQGFALVGKYVAKKTKSWLENGTASCSYYGYCYGCAAQIPNPDGKGGMTQGCGFGLQSCSGNESVVWQKEQIEYSYVLEILDPLDSKVLAAVEQSNPGATHLSNIAKVTSSCTEGSALKSANTGKDANKVLRYAVANGGHSM